MVNRIGWLVALIVYAGVAGAGGLEARLHWARTVTLSTPVPGVITEVLVQPGQRVKAGELLLRLDQRREQAGLQAAEARVAALDLRFGEAQRELARAQELYDQGLLSDTELMAARIAHAQARSEWQQARAVLERRRYALEHSVIRAPFDAWVVARQAEPGQVVASTMHPPPLLTLAEAGRLAVLAWPDDVRERPLSLGEQITVLWRGRRHAARVEQLRLDAQQPGRYGIWAVFDYAGPLPRGRQEVRLLLDDSI